MKPLLKVFALARQSDIALEAGSFLACLDLPIDSELQCLWYANSVYQGYQILRENLLLVSAVLHSVLPVH